MNKIYSTLLGLILLSLTAGEALAVCGNPSLSLDDARSKTQKFIQEMKISKARGDIETMSKTYVNNYEGLLKQCTEAEYLNLCTFDCHIQVGEYNLFMSNELSYYYTTTQSEMLKPEGMLKYAQDGVNIMERAKQLLATQQTGDFRDYIFKGGRYNLLLAQMYMTIGDIWYQSVSETKLQRLQYLIDNSLGTNTAADGKKSEVEEARANYEKANWVIQSSAMEIPMDDQQFSGLSADIFAQRYDTVKRLESLNKGYIFLNIDPEEFTSIPVAAVKDRLNLISSRIENAEKNIESLMTSWKQAKLNRDTDQVNDEARKKEISISQSSYRVAQLEGMAQNMSEQVGGQLDAIKAQQQTLDYEKQKYEYEFGLKMKLDELKGRQALISQRKDADITQFKLGDEDRKLNDLRWLMGWEISLANLQVQLSQFESEISRYLNDIEIKKNQIAQVTNRQTINKNQVLIAGETLKIAINNQTSLKTEKEQINQQNRLGLESQICSVRNRMKFIGMPVPAYTPLSACVLGEYAGGTETAYHDKMCGTDGKSGLRGQLADLKIKTVADALCVIGFDAIPGDMQQDPIVQKSLATCNSNIPLMPKSQLEFARQIWGRELALADAEISAAEQNRVLAYSGIATVGAQLAAATVTMATTQAVETTLEATLQATLAIPETTICACGMSTGALTKVPSASAMVSASLTTVREVKKTTMDWVKFVADGGVTLRALYKDIKAAEDTVSQGQMAKGIKNFHGMQAIMEILGKSQDYENDLQSRLIEKSTVTLDCGKEGGSLEENKTSLTAEYDRLVSEVKALGFKNSNLDLAILNEKSNQTREERSIDNLGLENSNLAIDIKSLQSEIATTNKLIQDTENRRKIILNLQGNLNGLENQAKATSLAITELTKLRNKQSLAISDTEYEQINKVINDQQTYTKGLVAFADDVNKLNQLDAGLRAELTAFKLDINKQVGDEREKILNTIYMQQKDAAGNPKEKLFMATEEEMAAFSKSVPAFIQEKRQLLEEANRLLVLLRNQVKALVSLQGDNPLSLSKSDPLIYVKNKDDLERLKGLVDDSFWKRDQQIVTQSTHILIPSGTGLARTLASDKRASFEISPFARGRMKELGYFSLWSEAFDADDNGLTQNLLLLDFNMLIDFPACSTKQAKRYVITHKGEGVVFKETSDNDPTPVPSLVTTEARTFSPSYAVTYSGSILAQTVDFWTKTFYLNNFLSTEVPPNYSSTGSLPVFVGLPVLGQYEIALPNPTEGCTYENASFDLYFTYATKQRASIF